MKPSFLPSSMQPELPIGGIKLKARDGKKSWGILSAGLIAVKRPEQRSGREQNWVQTDSGFGLTPEKLNLLR